MMSQKDELAFDLSELQGAFQRMAARYDKVKLLDQQKEYGRKKREDVPTSFEMINDHASSTRYKRRQETDEVLTYIHGGRNGAILGAWDFVSAHISQSLLDKLISSYKRGKYLQGIFGKAVKNYCQSEDAMKKAVAIKYQNYLSRRKYNFVCKTQNSVFDPEKELWVPRNLKCLGLDLRLPSLVSQDKVDNFVKALNIGYVSPIPNCSGVSRTVTGLVFMILDLHLRVPHLKKKLIWFNENEYNFIFQFSDDGAPETSELTVSIGSLTLWNFGEMVRSREYHYLLHCLSVKEKEEIMATIWKQHTEEMQMLEGNIFHVAGCECTVQFQPSADQSWQSWANNETTQAATYPSPFANVSKSNMNVVNGSIGNSESYTWKPFSLEQRKKDVERLESFTKSLPTNSSETSKHKRKLEFMAENGIRQLGYPRIGKYADLQRPEPVHTEINSWGHLISVIYREAVRRNRINEFLAILAAPVSHFTSKSQVPNEEKTSHKDQGSDKINIAEGTGERSCQVNLVISACSDFSDALSKVKNSSQKYSQAGCGLPFIANLIKDHYSDEKERHKSLSIRLIGEQAVQLARYSYRLLDSLAMENESEQERVKRLALCKISQLLRDAATLFNKVHVTSAEVSQLKEICQIYFNIYALFLPESLNITVWTLGYALPYHADLLYKEFKIGYGIISLQAKESKHAAVKYDLTLSNRSRSEGINGKWFQVMRANYVRAFYLPEHHPLPSMYVSHFTSRIPPNAENDVCLCSRPTNFEDSCETCVLAENLIVRPAIEGKLTAEVVSILKPIVCPSCSTRFSDVASLEVHGNIHKKSVPARLNNPIHVRSLKLEQLKAELRKYKLSLSGNKTC